MNITQILKTTKRIFGFSRVLPALAGLALILPATAQAAGTPQTKANTTTMNLGTDWVSGTAPTSADTATWQNSPITITNNLVLKLGGNFSCNQFDFRNSSATPNSYNLIINDDGLGSVLSIFGNSSGNDAGAVSMANGGPMGVAINCPVKLSQASGGGYFRVTYGALSIGGSISELTAGRSFNKQGRGTVNLAGANTYTGGTTIQSGGGVLTLTGSGTLGSQTTPGVLTLSATSGEPGILDLGGTTQMATTVNFGAGSVVQNGTLNGTAFRGFGVVSANLTGTGNIYLDNNGNTLVLSGNNSYSGPTVVQGGTILATKPAALPNSGVSGTITLNNANSALLVIRAGGAGEWGASDIGSLLGNASFTVAGTTAIGLGIDTTGGDFTYSSAIPAKANMSLQKRGPNTLTFSGANLYTRPTLINGGTIKIDAGAGGSLAATSALTFNGSGTLNYDNTTASGAKAQSMGALTFSVGEGTVQLTRTASQTVGLTFSSLATRTAGATRNFVLAGTPGVNGTDSSITLTGRAAGYIDQGSFFGGSSYAWMNGSGTYVRGMSYGSDASAVTSGAAMTLASATHQQITGAISAQNTATFTTLNISGNNNVALAAVQTVTVNGILKTGNTAGGATISGGSGIQAPSAGELVIRTDGANDALTISTPILENSVSSLTKSGAGTLTLSTANTFTGGVRLNAGQLNINHATALGGSTVSRLTINEGTVLDNTSGAPVTMTIKYPVTFNGNFTFIGSSDLYFPLDGAGLITMPNDVTITVSNRTLEIPYSCSGTSARLTKNGPGTLRLGNNGGFNSSGGLAINNGVVYGTYAQDFTVCGTGPVFLGDEMSGNHNNAILDYLGSNMHDNPITVRAGSDGVLALVASASSPSWYGPLMLNTNLTITCSGGNGGTLSYFGIISGSGGLNIGNTGTYTNSGAIKNLVNSGVVSLWRANTYTGNTAINTGTLKLNGIASINSSPLLHIAAGAKLDVSTIPTFTLSSSTTLSAASAGQSATITGMATNYFGVVDLGTRPITLAYDGANPALVISAGTLKLSGQTITVNTASPLPNGTYNIIQQTTGNINASGSFTLAGTAGTGTIAVSGSNVQMTITGSSTAVVSTLTLSANDTKTYGTTSTLTATVKTNNVTAVGATGTVQFYMDGSQLGSPVALVSGVATIPNTATLFVAGARRITATYSGDSVFAPSASTGTAPTLTVNKVALGITASADSKTYGQTKTYGANMTAFTSSGLKNGETIGSVTITASGGTAANSAVASYNLTPSAAGGGTFNPNNYTITYNNGTLTVSAAPLTVTANADSKTYGQTRTYGAGSIAFTSSGLMNNETIGSVTITASGGTAANAAIGPYTLTPSLATGGTFAAGNYTITYNTGTLTVGKASLSITADAYVKFFGETATFGAGSTAFTSIGLLSGETIGSVTITASGGTQSADPIGTYNLTPSDATGGSFDPNNYTITYHDGILSVSVGVASITAWPTASAISYGQVLSNSTLSGGSASTPGVFTFTAPTTLPSVGTYMAGGTFTPDDNGTAIVVSNAVISVTVNPTTLTVTADNKVRYQGAPNPTFTYTITGYTNGENAASAGVTGVPALSTTATEASPEGTYTITCAQGTLGGVLNYTYSFTNGTLSVGLLTWLAGTGTWDINNAYNWTNSVAGVVQYVDGVAVMFNDNAIGSGPYTVTLNTTVTPNGVTVNNPTKAYTFTGGSIGGTNSLTKQGAGMLTLAYSNSLSGGITASTGTLVVANQYALGTGTLTLGSGLIFKQDLFEGNSAAGAIANTINLSGGNVSIPLAFGGAKDIWLTGPITGSGGLTVSGDTRTLTLYGNSSFSGGVTFQSSSCGLSIGHTNALGTGVVRSEKTTLGLGLLTITSDLSAGNGVQNPIDLAPNSYLNLNVGSPLKLSGVITNSGTLVKMGTAALTLSGASTYNGITKIVSGKIQLSTDNNLGASTLMSGGGFYDVGANTFTLNHSVTGAVVVSVTSPGNLTVAGNLAGGGLGKAGTGTMTMGSGVTVSLADFIDATGIVNVANTLAISKALYLGNVRVSLADGSSFTLNGEDVVTPTTNSHRVVTASSGTLSITPPLPGGTNGIIGGATSGSSSFNPATGVVTVDVIGAGDPQGDNHVWHYTSMPSGDFDFRARIASGAVGWNRLGLMIRDGLTKSDNFAAVWATGGQPCAAYGITGTVTYREDYPGTVANWVRIKRVGMTVTTLYSTDNGVTYSEGQTKTFTTWGATTYVGLDVNYATVTATFDNVSFLGAGTMPDWSTTDLAINSGAKMNLNYTGNATIGKLTFDNVLKSAGPWGATGSGATNVDDSRFAGTGTVTATVVPPKGTVLIIR